MIDQKLIFKMPLKFLIKLVCLIIYTFNILALPNKYDNKQFVIMNNRYFCHYLKQ